MLSQESCDSILNLHGFRNTAYHQGQRHEAILRSIAVFYFINAATFSSTTRQDFGRGAATISCPTALENTLGKKPGSEITKSGLNLHLTGFGM